MSESNIQTLKYVTDKERGPTLFSEMKNPQWVELIKNYTNVYFYPSMPEQSYSRCKEQALTHWHYGYDDLGFVRCLSLDRRQDTFVMPLFASQTDGIINLTCGYSRFVANLVNGVEANEIPLIVLSTTPPTKSGWQEINTTQQFTELFNLSDVDHEISIDMTDNFPTVTRSVIRHSVYDYDNQAIQHASMNDSVKRFWNRFDKKKTIDITIYCTEETRSLIQDAPWFNITYLIQKPEEWQFSFGKILGAYKSDHGKALKAGELSLWLYDITEPVYLQLLFPWATDDVATYYSDNKKSVLIDTSHKTSTAIIGNWVK